MSIPQRFARGIALLVTAASIGATACELPRDAADDGRIDAADGTVIAWKTAPAGYAVDRHFSLLIRACSDAPIADISVDAQMPEHRHGMNYKPAIARVGDGWRADGLLFHMPGKWEITFAVSTAKGLRRYSHPVSVR